MNRRKTIELITASVLTVIGLTLSAVVLSHATPFSVPTEAGAYTLTLNDSNGVSGTNVTETKSITTDSGNYQVEFKYTNCDALNNGHATIRNGGKIENVDHIRSIYQLVANFSGGTLRFRSSYDGATWSGYTTMTSTEVYSLGSNPYYIELSASNSNVNLTSVTFSYTCLENPDAIGTTTTTDDTWERVDSASELVSGDEIVITASWSSYWYSVQNTAISEQRYYWLNAEPITLSSNKTEATVTESNSVWTITTGSTSGTWKLQSNSKYLKAEVVNSNYNLGLTTTYSSSSCDWTLSFSSSSVSMTNSGVNLYLKRYGSSPNYGYEFAGQSSTDIYTKYIFRKVPGESHTDYPIPVDETGFTATDSNANNYTTNSIFDNEKGLVVKAQYNNNTEVTLNDSQYSYAIKNSNNILIDTSTKFPEAGDYTLIVSYKSYIPVEIPLHVGVYTFLTSISARMTNRTFNTADVLSNTISDILAVDMHYNVSSADQTVYYSNLSQNGLSVSLIDSNGVTKAMTSPFGVAGTWTVKVVLISNPSIYSEVTLTVSAIQVIDISMSDSSLSLYVGDHANLSVTFNPTNATNQNVAWTSSDSSKVSVVGNGSEATVTANAVTTEAVTITAASEDGNHTATCAITVKKKATPTTATIVANNPTTNTSTSVSYSSGGFVATGVTITGGSLTQAYGTSDGFYRMGSQKNAGSITLNISNLVITGITLHANAYDSNAVVNIATSANTTGENVTISGDGDYSTTAFASDTEESTSITITNAKNNRYYFVGLTLTIGTIDPIYPETITLANQNIAVGEAVTLEPEFYPTDTNQTNVTWSSSNESVATVDNTGLVTGIAEGSATITCTGKDESNHDVIGTCTVTVHTVAVTGVSVKSTDTVSVGSTITLSATVTPANATNKAVTWSSSNTSTATVNTNTGLVTGVAAGTAVITATTVDGHYQASCTVTVTETQIDEWTLLFYVCGADLESADYLDDSNYTEAEAYEYGYGDGTLAGYASRDIDELLAVNNQPSNVNIVLETGGATQWGRSDLNSHRSKLARWEIRNKQLQFKEETNSYASMGLSTTLQSFLEWGMKNYPARKYGLFMWNHGGALDGCCFDEKASNDSLTAPEVQTAVSAAKSARSYSGKFEFIAYDACLMAVQDIAEINSQDFKYMIASQESEYAGGYDYDAWLPTLYNNPTTVTTAALLTEVGETFMTEQNTTATEYNEYYNLTPSSSYYWPLDQTQAVYDLSKMAAYKSAFESLASSLASTATGSTLKTAINKAQKYGYYSSSSYNNSTYNYGYVYNVFDVEMALDEIKKSYSSLSTQVDAVKAALSDMIIYEDHGADTKGCGLNLYYPIAKVDTKNTYRATTNFDNWYSLVTESGFGNWATGY